MAHSRTFVYLCRSLSNIESFHVYNLTLGLKKAWRILHRTVCNAVHHFLFLLFFFFFRDPREAVVNKTCMACHPECQPMNGTATCSAPVCFMCSYTTAIDLNSCKCKKNNTGQNAQCISVTHHERVTKPISPLIAAWKGQNPHSIHETCCILSNGRGLSSYFTHTILSLVQNNRLFLKSNSRVK